MILGLDCKNLNYQLNINISLENNNLSQIIIIFALTKPALNE